MSSDERYGTRELTFSTWHRYFMPPSAAMIDLDGVEYCDVQGCAMPLALIETARDVGQSFKATTVMERIARLMNVPAVLVLYESSEEPCRCHSTRRMPGCLHGIASMRVKRVFPVRGQLVRCEPQSLADWLIQTRETHQQQCHRPLERRSA